MGKKGISAAQRDRQAIIAEYNGLMEDSIPNAYKREIGSEIEEKIFYKKMINFIKRN